ncbi:hypothetical protein O6H91_11G065600 [Diphasiastrum complanatum]|uniref:Uncharacterized protein n=1 Tax=Diphasiastrum complanatum TaxID=34168 RepID=A0ACC2CA49_DIPCM|nr:hypothetical protein O6H91_11G065600 [Diphasiastrum complanatum]
MQSFEICREMAMLVIVAGIDKELVLGALLLLLYLQSGLVMAGLPPTDRPAVYGFDHLDHASAHGLNYGFYKDTCPEAEAIICSTVREFYWRDPSIAAGLLRMLFHDCFVQGCDASLLLVSTPGRVCERDAIPNANSLRGFEAIFSAKQKLEQICPRTVSCADILALSARESVLLAGGPYFPLATGRRDGLTSIAKLAEVNLPNPFDNITALISSFTRRGFEVADMVALLGAHSIGHSHCRFFRSRLYNFSGTGFPDPTINKQYLELLRKVCPCCNSPSVDATMSLDLGSENRFDSSYFRNLEEGKGVLRVDQELVTSNVFVASIVGEYSIDENAFFQQFAKAMMKLSNMDVLTGYKGEIRRDCSFVS